MRAAIARRARISETDLDALEHLEAEGPSPNATWASGSPSPQAQSPCSSTGWKLPARVTRPAHPDDRRYTLLELSAKAAQDTPAGLAAYHAAITDLVAKTPARERETIAAFLRAAADAAATATQQLSSHSARRRTSEDG